MDTHYFYKNLKTQRVGCSTESISDEDLHYKFLGCSGVVRQRNNTLPTFIGPYGGNKRISLADDYNLVALSPFEEEYAYVPMRTLFHVLNFEKTTQNLSAVLWLGVVKYGIAEIPTLTELQFLLKYRDRLQFQKFGKDAWNLLPGLRREGCPQDILEFLERSVIKD